MQSYVSCSATNFVIAPMFAAKGHLVLASVSVAVPWGLIAATAAAGYQIVKDRLRLARDLGTSLRSLREADRIREIVLGYDVKYRVSTVMLEFVQNSFEQNIEFEVVSKMKNAETAAKLSERNAQLDAALAALDAAARDLHARAIPTIEQVQDVLVASALELAEAILGRELMDTKNSARAALARVLDHADPRTLLTVRMNPDDIAELDAAGRPASGVEIIADDTIARGDALGDFSDGYLDARIQTALARARAALLGETI